ncbi:MAG: hypothetical protein IT378_01705 [Sandaracinaceae bacterium]|nr:hypothetical protein [Sandaracinaceae bacterium]
MSQRADRRVEGLLYAVTGALALAGAAVAFAVRCDEGQEQVSSPMALDAGVAEDAGVATARAVDDFVPDLPEVPDLATQPPPAAPPTGDDPRLRQLGAEMRLLSRAREQLAEHPAEALSLLDQHRRLHADGVLREEREAFAIEALLALERADEAERRYYDFRRAFPQSDFTSRLERAMQRPRHEVGEHGR